MRGKGREGKGLVLPDDLFARCPWICKARFRTSNVLMSQMSGTEICFQVPPKAFRLDSQIVQ